MTNIDGRPRIVGREYPRSVFVPAATIDMPYRALEPGLDLVMPRGLHIPFRLDAGDSVGLHMLYHSDYPRDLLFFEHVD